MSEMSIEEKLKEEIQNLKSIIAKEMSENDEFGAEFVHVSILKEDCAKMANLLARAAADRDKWKAMVELIKSLLTEKSKRSNYNWSESGDYFPSDYANEGMIILAAQLLAKLEEMKR